jgi:hypothetical protein
MLGRVARVRTAVSGVPSASIIRMTRRNERGTMLAVTINRIMLRRNIVVLVVVVVFLRRVRRLPVMANVVPISSILVTLMMEARSFPQKRRFLHEAHGKMAFFIVNAVKTSTLTMKL